MFRPWISRIAIQSYPLVSIAAVWHTEAHTYTSDTHTHTIIVIVVVVVIIII